MPRRRGKESRAEKVFKEIMAENFLDLGGPGGGAENKPNLEIQEAEWIPDKIKSKKPIQRHIILMKSKEKWKLFRLEKKKKDKNCQLWVLYLAKVSFGNEGGKLRLRELREWVSTTPALERRPSKQRAWSEKEIWIYRKEDRELEKRNSTDYPPRESPKWCLKLKENKSL